MSFGSEVDSTQQAQSIASIRVYPGANGSFSLFQDDGKTYAYEKGTDSIKWLTWDDVKHQFKHESAQQFSEIHKAKITAVGK